MSWVDIFTNLAEPADGRVAPAFGAHQAAVALIMIGRQQPLGRYDLCENLTIGEGSVRTLLKRFSEAGLILPEGRQGQKLTEDGQNLFENILEDIPIGLYLDLGGLAVYSQSFAFLVRGMSARVKDGIRQRDEAIIQGGYGSAGATTLIVENGMVLMPPDNFNTLLEYEKETLLIMDSLRPKDGDSVVIGSAEDRNLAREVSMAAVMTLFEDDK